MRGPNRTRLDLLLELETLDRVPRSGYLLRGVSEGESVAEHSYHLAMLVWLLAAEEPGLDRARAVELALLHDLAELRVGDLPRTAVHYFEPGAKHAAELRAARDILAPAGGAALERLDEYDRAESPEARFVRACDKLQLMLKVAVYEAWGSSALAEFWEQSDNFPDAEFRSVRGLFDELVARRAERRRPAG
jgi:putative hydrolase of HD superfamily